MAQHPFAQQAREAMEQEGIVFNPDGTTSMKQPTQSFVGGQETTDTPASVQPTGDEQETLLEMQRRELEQLRAEKAQWQQSQQSTNQQPSKSEREIELEEELAELRGQIKHQTEEQQADEFRSLLERQGFDSENLDDDVLLEIRDTFVKPMANKVTALEERLARLDDKFRDPTPQERVEKIKVDTWGKIRKDLPDVDTIFNSKEFQDKLQQKDTRFPTKTYGHALQMALEDGNADFIVREIHGFMNGGNAQNLASIADVSASNGVGNRPATTQGQTGGYQFTNEEAVQMLRKRQIGDISRQEYSDYIAKLDAHRSRA